MLKVCPRLLLACPLIAAACGTAQHSNPSPGSAGFGSSTVAGSAGATAASASLGGAGSGSEAGGSSSGAAGSASGDSSSTAGSSAVNAGANNGGDTGGCTPGAAQCEGDSAVQICAATGHSEPPWPCATGTCSAGACTGLTAEGTSCSADGSGLTSCGSSSENCCTSLEVPGGTYYRTFTNNGTGASELADPATVSGFRLDKYLVTVARFRKFAAAWAQGYVPPAGSGKHTHLSGSNGLSASGGGAEPGWLAADDDNLAPTDVNLACDPQFSTWTPSAGSQEDLPINCVNWYEAAAFCIWDGGFLPSEAEWEYAAAGASQQREYPWGSTDPGTMNAYAIYGDANASYYSSGAGGLQIAPVGSALQGAGRWGQLDLAGELWEWNLDWFVPFAACFDCANFTTDQTRVIRGGEFLYDASYLHTVYRSGSAPTFRANDIGLRCARSP